MAWCHEAPSHYMNQWWLSSLVSPDYDKPDDTKHSNDYNFRRIFLKVSWAVNGYKFVPNLTTWLDISALLSALFTIDPAAYDLQRLICWFVYLKLNCIPYCELYGITMKFIWKILHIRIIWNHNEVHIKNITHQNLMWFHICSTYAFHIKSIKYWIVFLHIKFFMWNFFIWNVHTNFILNGCEI